MARAWGSERLHDTGSTKTVGEITRLSRTEDESVKTDTTIGSHSDVSLIVAFRYLNTGSSEGMHMHEVVASHRFAPTMPDHDAQSRS